MNANEKGFNLFWENYQRAVEWQNGSRISHWKSRARALEVENALLRNFILRELEPESSQKNLTQHSESYGNSFEDCGGIEEDFENQDDKQSAPDNDEELLAFYEKTARHQLERDKNRSVNRSCDEESQSENEAVYSMGSIPIAQKTKDMSLLYGDDASKIFSMELSMQINFDMHCNKSSAQLWPNIPLRLS